MGLTGLILAFLAWVVGRPAVALGIVLGTPIGLLNHLLTMPLVKPGPRGGFPRSITWRLPLRFALAVAGLLIGYRIGIETMIGAAIGETIEAFLYTLSAAMVALRTVGGRSRSGDG